MPIWLAHDQGLDECLDRMIQTILSPLNGFHPRPPYHTAALIGAKHGVFLQQYGIFYQCRRNVFIQVRIERLNSILPRESACLANRRHAAAPSPMLPITPLFSRPGPLYRPFTNDIGVPSHLNRPRTLLCVPDFEVNTRNVPVPES